MNFVFVDNGLPLTPTIYTEMPIGGSELSLLLLCEGLAELDNFVILLNSNPTSMISPTIPNLLFYHNFHLPFFLKEGDVFVFNRVLPNLKILEKLKDMGKKCLYWSHDAYDQPNVQWLGRSELVKLFDVILCVSSWQVQTFIKYFNIDEGTIKILPNACFKEEWINGYDIRKYDFVFASIPYKGLYLIKEIFDNVCIRSKRDDLNFLVLSSFELYRREDDELYKKEIERLRSTMGITIREILPPVDLLRLFKQCRFYIHPSTYHETFGMVVVQAQANGCIPIVVNNGALPEIVIDKVTGRITRGVNIYDRSTFDEFVDIIVESINDKDREREMRQRAESYVTTYRYRNIAAKLIELVGG